MADFEGGEFGVLDEADGLGGITDDLGIPVSTVFWMVCVVFAAVSAVLLDMGGRETDDVVEFEWVFVDVEELTEGEEAFVEVAIEVTVVSETPPSLVLGADREEDEMLLFGKADGEISSVSVIVGVLMPHVSYEESLKRGGYHGDRLCPEESSLIARGLAVSAA